MFHSGPRPGDFFLKWAGRYSSLSSCSLMLNITSTPFVFVLSFFTFIWVRLLALIFLSLQICNSINVYVNVPGYLSGHLSGVSVSFWMLQIIRVYTSEIAIILEKYLCNFSTLIESILLSLVKFIILLLTPTGFCMRRTSFKMINEKISKRSGYDNLILLKFSFLVWAWHILLSKAFSQSDGKNLWQFLVVSPEYISKMLFN